MVSRNSPFVIARQELNAKREIDVEKLLGKSLYKKLEQFGYDQFMKRGKEALKRHQNKVGNPK